MFWRQKIRHTTEGKGACWAVWPAHWGLVGTPACSGGHEFKVGWLACLCISVTCSAAAHGQLSR